MLDIHKIIQKSVYVKPALAIICEQIKNLDFDSTNNLYYNHQLFMLDYNLNIIGRIKWT